MSGGRARQVAGGIVLILLAVAIGQGLDRLRPTIIDQQGPFVRTAPVGEAVDLRLASLTVTGVRGSRSVVTRDVRYNADTEGVFVAVSVRVVPYSSPMAFAVFEARDDAGNRFLPTTKTVQRVAPGVSFQPGYGTEGEIVFEVPVSAAQSLRLWGQISRSVRVDAVGDVPLAITPADVATWHGSSERLVPHELAVAA